MLYINLLVNQIKGDRSRKKTAREELWRAQSHYVYWHGNHLGIYDKSLRERSYRFLIEAELSTREKGIFKSGINHFDFDMDGKKEALYQGDNYNAYISCKGGILFELDYIKRKRNILSTVMRVEEAYHSPKHRKNGYDTYIRKMFHDHFISEETTIEEFNRQSFMENGSFINSNYDNVGLNRENKSINLNGKGFVRCFGVEHSVNIGKKYNFNKGNLILTYNIENMEDSVLETYFAPEFNLSLGGEKKDSTISFSDGAESSIINKSLSTKNIDNMLIDDKDYSTKINISFSLETDRFWITPQISKSLENGVINDIYQFTTFLPQWKIKISPKSTWSLTINLSLN